jgi:hypothetical protein
MRYVPVALALAALLPAGYACAGTESVPLYTNDDLDRMFGPAPPPVSSPVDKTTPEDWRWVEQYIDRQYARIDADRQYDLDRVSLAIAARQNYSYYPSYPVAWSLGYPASVWWPRVHGSYQRGLVDHGMPHAAGPSASFRQGGFHGSSFGSPHGNPGGSGTGHDHR